MKSLRSQGFSQSPEEIQSSSISLGLPWWLRGGNRLLATRETWVRSLGQEDTLQKEMATHSSILAWRIPWTEEPGGLQSTGSRRVRHY